mmetsp:Transcript_14098/g.30608  ORF Transcript_14098/g.30608 Transcript_14098/m.30608 type:complete len:214 (+) Transcript_14098:634-1275(+)
MDKYIFRSHSSTLPFPPGKPSHAPFFVPFSTRSTPTPSHAAPAIFVATFSSRAAFASEVLILKSGRDPTFTLFFLKRGRKRVVVDAWGDVDAELLHGSQATRNASMHDTFHLRHAGTRPRRAVVPRRTPPVALATPSPAIPHPCVPALSTGACVPPFACILAPFAPSFLFSSIGLVLVPLLVGVLVARQSDPAGFGHHGHGGRLDAKAKSVAN